ncbi:hypothetical protein A5790_00840 [Mycobacterium sp. 852002-51152_SCH6134967]|nr:hypothetical protein A5790_00840 [Mycobacterium sp. 852002-51152_SCH6134967]
MNTARESLNDLRQTKPKDREAIKDARQTVKDARKAVKDDRKAAKDAAKEDRKAAKNGGGTDPGSGTYGRPRPLRPVGGVTGPTTETCPPLTAAPTSSRHQSDS